MQSYRKGKVTGIADCLVISAAVLFGIRREEVRKFLKEEIELIEADEEKILFELVLESKSLGEVKRGMRLLRWAKNELEILETVEAKDERIVRYVEAHFENDNEMERAMSLLKMIKKQLIK